MSTIHMDIEIVYEQGRKMVSSTSDMLNMIDQLRYAVQDLQQAWSSPTATARIREMERLIDMLFSQAHKLEDLGLKVMREVDEWVNVDRTKSAYWDALRESFQVSFEDAQKLFAGTLLASTLRWTLKRPNSVVFTGPNWLRKAIGIKEMTRVIKPATLARGMAIAGLMNSAYEAIEAGIDAFLEYRQEDVSRAISAASVDSGFKFALTSVGKVGIPLALGVIVGAVGLPVVAGGAVVVAGSVLLTTAYSKFVEAPVWEMWKQSTLRIQVIEACKRSIDRLVNFVSHQKDQAVQGVRKAFSNFINAISTAPATVTSLPRGGNL